MVFDKNENLSRYISKKDATAILKFLKSVTSETKLGKYELDGERLFAIVTELQTRDKEAAILEAHNLYLDFHFPLNVPEKNQFYHRGDMIEKVAYDKKCEAALYHFPAKKNELILNPGYFTLYFTDDAHAPSLAVGKPKMLRKVIVKLKA